MKKVRPVWLWRLACFLWLVLIFSQSAMPAPVSQAESSGLLYFLVQIFPFLTEYLLRKLAHFAEFAILGILLGKSLRGPAERLLLTGLLCALCDETIQLFVAGRSSQVSDIWVDFSGILASAVFLWVIRRIRSRMAGHP
ncbi:MAG: VanZ family protein [Ruminococcaceae bacterium]|nr:VanZ family protein [Oscillospiraceae bacterium]